MKAFFASILALLSCACACSSPPSANVKTPTAVTEPSQSKAIVFVEDDYAGALAEARRSHRPLFVDTWASWCHTCLSMREYVFVDPQIRAMAGRFVWLAIDTEKAENNAFLAAHPMDAWPTLWVIDPENEAAALKWNGSATAAELVSLLDDAEGAVKRRDAGGEAAAAYVRGNQATGAGKNDEAIADYEKALATAPAGWARRARAVEALAGRLFAKHDLAKCASLAASEMPQMPPGTSVKAVALYGLLCIEELPKDARAPHAEAILAMAGRIVSDEHQPILADDRSELFEELVGTLKEVGRAEEARAIATKWAAFLEREAAKAKTPAARAVFDAHLTDAYVELGVPASAIAPLTKSEQDFPRDFNPPARLANAYLAMKDYDHALAAIDRALALAHGPRRLRLFSVKATIQDGKGDLAGERATLTEAVTLARSLTLIGSVVRTRADLEKRLDRMTK